MGGVYGDFILAFPEQFTSITVYSMTARINGGWIKDENSDRIIRGIFQHTGGRRIKDSNGNKAAGSSAEFWTETPGLNGMFTTVDGVVYALLSDNDWKNEGGFIKYGLDKVVGNNGSESDDTSWNTGSDNFG